MTFNRHRACSVLLFVAFVSGPSVSINAQNPAYINQLPSPSQVAQAFATFLPDQAEVFARRAGALWQMPGVIVALAAAEGRTESQLTPIEKSLIADYRSSYTSHWQAVQKQVGDDRARLAALEAYKTDASLLMHVLEDVSPPALVARYRAASAHGATTASANTARYYTTDSGDEFDIAAIDMQSLQRRGAIVAVNQFELLADGLAGSEFFWADSAVEIDCAAHRMRKRNAGYATLGRRNRMPPDARDVFSAWENIRPRSRTANMETLLCGGPRADTMQPFADLDVLQATYLKRVHPEAFR
jgi:hypothetical protein